MGIKAQFEEKVAELLALKEIPDIDTRIKQVEDLTEWYYEKTGKVCRDSFQLTLLGNYILSDILKDKNPHKVKKTTYPVLSRTQLKKRNRRERRVGDDNLDFIKLKEVDSYPNTFKVSTKNKED